MRNEREAHAAMSAAPNTSHHVKRRDVLGEWRPVVWTAVAWAVALLAFWTWPWS